jgi:hypothetical protein
LRSGAGLSQPYRHIVVMAFLGMCCASAIRPRSLALAQAPASNTLTLGARKDTTPFQGPRTSHQSFCLGDFVYVVGGYLWDSAAQRLVLYDDVQFARVGADGLIEAQGWKTTTPFRTPRLGHSVALLKNRVILSGGGDGNMAYYDDVQTALLTENGTVDRGGWTLLSHKLNVRRAVHGSVVATIDGTSYLYVVGGVGDVGGKTVHFDTVEYARIEPDGTVGEWRMAPFHFKGGRSSPACVALAGRLYVIGGWGDANDDIFPDVQSAPLEKDGTPGVWTSLVGLATPRYGHSVVQPDEKAFLVVGGNAGSGAYLDTMEYTVLSEEGRPTVWRPATPSLPIPRWGHTAVIHKKHLLVLGGAGRGVFLNDVKVAELP